jgi:hypothetical protein
MSWKIFFKGTNMNRLIAMVVGLSLFTNLYALGEPSFKIKAVQSVSSDDLPNGLPFKVKPFGYSQGFKIYYLIEGENLVKIKKDSLDLAYIKGADGKDISTMHGGKKAYRLGSFPKVTDDGKYASFALESKINQFGKVDSLSLKGTITVFVASKHKEDGVEMSVGATNSVGPFSVEVTPNKFRSNRISVNVMAPYENVIDVKIMDGDKELKSKSSSWNPKSKNYSFDKPKSEKFMLKISYWLDMKERNLPFETK